MALLLVLVLAVPAGGWVPGDFTDGRLGESAQELVVPELQLGDHGPLVVRLNRLLAASGFRPGESDVFDEATVQAVYAFQKYHGLERDGIFRPSDWELLGEPPAIRWRPERNRVEIDLAKQLLYLVQEGRVTAVLPVSSGNGQGYQSYTGRWARATTPEGEFSFYNSIDGLRRSYLGTLYRPFYFRGGYALHGSPNVPPYPASHGCVRVTYADMDFLWDHLELEMTIYVYGDRTEAPPVAPVGSFFNSRAP